MTRAYSDSDENSGSVETVVKQFLSFNPYSHLLFINCENEVEDLTHFRVNSEFGAQIEVFNHFFVDFGCVLRR